MRDFDCACVLGVHCQSIGPLSDEDETGKTMNHAAGSLEEMVENLVKNWEVEASFKPRLSDWRTIDHENYSFAMGGGPPM